VRSLVYWIALQVIGNLAVEGEAIRIVAEHPTVAATARRLKQTPE
jgi:hypothetical protein